MDVVFVVVALALLYMDATSKNVRWNRCCCHLFGFCFLRTDYADEEKKTQFGAHKLSGGIFPAICLFFQSKTKQNSINVTSISGNFSESDIGIRKEKPWLLLHCTLYRKFPFLKFDFVNGSPAEYIYVGVKTCHAYRMILSNENEPFQKWIYFAIRSQRKGEDEWVSELKVLKTHMRNTHV